jgi:hypothetical protein
MQEHYSGISEKHEAKVLIWITNVILVQPQVLHTHFVILHFPQHAEGNG